MKSNILDRSESYLRIFTENFLIDRNLPKWSKITEDNKDSLSKKASGSSLGEALEPFSPTANDNRQQISILDFINLDKKDFNIYIGKSLADRVYNDSDKFKNMLTPIGDSVSSRESKKKEPDIIKKLIRVFTNEKREKKEETVYELDIIKFFEQVKLTSKESAKNYVERIKPYMIALKRANDMGQTALADQLSAQIFNNKYESILQAEGFNYKISEEQLVSFVKKTEKGVRLDYIKNFTHNIPDEVYEKKTKADSVLVFDNYCVLYYDPDLKSYKLTKEEEERIRRKKSDPILFGMINGSRNLYYIADWIDEYCDLTLEEFIKVSGLDKKEISINEKIKL
jgi:hypothetical protein